MDREIKLIQSLQNRAGRISHGNGRGVQVTFSLYRYQEFVRGQPGAVSADGLCRVSDGSSALDELFNAGASAILSSKELETTIQLTSSYTFIVNGPIIEKRRPPRFGLSDS
jgi:hypothetical protein